MASCEGGPGTGDTDGHSCFGGVIGSEAFEYHFSQLKVQDWISHLKRLSTIAGMSHNHTQHILLTVMAYHFSGTRFICSLLAYCNHWRILFVLLLFLIISYWDMTFLETLSETYFLYLFNWVV